MHRALALLNYIPAVLCGLLVVAWVVTLSQEQETMLGNCHVALASGSLEVAYAEIAPGFAIWLLRSPDNHHGHRLGRLTWRQGPSWHYLSVPIPILLAFCLPVAVGCLTRFRFPLWSYFAWTALVAAELAYYLR
jgi:hypothetical protein